MTPEQRSRASIDLTLTYLQSVYPDWRLAEVLTAKKLLNERYSFYKDIIHDIKQYGDESGEATIAQELRHGLYFDAISHCVQYVEDLFALINASKKPDFFVRNIIQFKAGVITNQIKAFKATPKSIAEAFHFPPELPFENNDDKKTYDEGVDRLADLMTDIIKFHKDYEYFYNQFKHGLSVAMRPFGNMYVQEQIEEDKKGDFRPYLAVYDNRNLETAAKKGTFTIKKGAFMTGFTENVRPYIGQLIKENNFIRLVHPEHLDLDIDFLVDVAFKVRTCLKIFIYNYSHKIDIRQEKNQFQLPIDHRSNDVLNCAYRNDED